MAQKYDLYNLGASSEQPPLDSRHLIEVKKASNKGRGIFAKAALPRGTRVVAESPLLSPNTQGSLRTPINLEQLFQALPEDKQSAYVQLYGDAGDFVKQIVDEDFETELGRKLSAIYYLNRIEDDLLWLGSIFNHSCIPNICYTHNAATKKYTFQTIHAVEAGEELTISYLGGVIESREKRQDEFGRQWNFHCLCQACTDDAKEQQLVDLILLWKKHEADVKNRQSYKERLPTLQSLARLTLSSGLVGAELSTCYEKNAKNSAMSGEVTMAKLWTQREAEVVKYCIGEDNPVYKELAVSLDELIKAEASKQPFHIDQLTRWK